MVDDSRLELSLGLSFGGSSSRSKVKDAISDPKIDEGSANKHMGNNMTISEDSLKNFFKSGPENYDSKGKQKSELVAYRQESFFTDLSKCSSPIADCSNDVQSKFQLAKYQDLWISNNRTIDVEEEKSGSSKRKFSFEEINFQNKHEKLIDYADKNEKNSTEAPSRRNLHFSITAEDGSTCSNEDAAVSEAGGLNSWLGLQREEKAKCSSSFNHISKNIPIESSSPGFHGHKEPCLSGREPNPDLGKATFGIPLSLQPVPVMTGPYPVSTVPSNSSGPNAACIPPIHAMQLMSNVNGERPVVPSNANNMQLAFTHPSTQLPTLEKSSSWTFNSQQLHASSFNSRKQYAGFQIRDHFEDGVKASQGSASQNASGPSPHDGKSSESTIGEANKSRNTNKTANEAKDDPTTEGHLAPSFEFGGHVSPPDLPWVSATGQGPNGKTITGVTYKHSQTEAKVVCACHGIHMSQEEFVRHAGGDNMFPSSNTTC